jgi:hypothetical protein
MLVHDPRLVIRVHEERIQVFLVARILLERKYTLSKL